ncbi:MAG: DUF2330 domain-containing protein [Sedimentisphaerales bacterium]|nr:DUF2330 domain-containing protein [Sedimentisphaerales bacterium]
MKARETLSVMLLTVLVAGATARGDRGAIIAVDDVNLQEPAQRALIAHNGLEEILILQTDVQASKAATVVEFMPLPSRPTVYLAKEECFKALQETIDRHGLRYVVRTRGVAAEGDEGSAVRVVLAEQLGPHQVTVVEVSDVDGFLEWVRQFFKDNGLGKPNLGGELRRVVTSYLDDGLRFFAFDVIKVTNERQTVRPLIYRFKGQELYYPLRVTNLYGGRGTIELLIILPKDLVSRMWRLYISPSPEYVTTDGTITYKLWRSETAELSCSELERIEPSLVGLFDTEVPVLGALKYEGPLVFATDVNQQVGYHTSETQE